MTTFCAVVISGGDSLFLHFETVMLRDFVYLQPQLNTVHNSKLMNDYLATSEYRVVGSIIFYRKIKWN